MICWGRSRSISWGRSRSISWGRCRCISWGRCRCIRWLSWSRSIRRLNWGRSIGLSLRVDWNSLISDLSNESIVVISGVLNMLGSAIGKCNSVLSSHSSISISGLSSTEGSLGVVISNSIGVGVGLWSLLFLMVGGRSMVSRGSLNNWSIMDNRGIISSLDRGTISSLDNGSSMDNRGIIGSLDWGTISSWSSMYNRGTISSWSSMDNRGSMNNWSRMVRSSMNNWSGVVRGSMNNWSRSIGNRVRKSSRCMHTSNWLLIVSIAVDRLGSSMWLAHNGCYMGSMWLEDRRGDRWSISDLDSLVVGLVSGNNSQQSCTDKCLKTK
jgi:hypothetical protein